MDDILNLELLRLRKKTKEEPDNPMSWVEYGDFLLEQLELYQDAIKAFEKASKLLGSLDLRLRIGEAMFLDGEKEEGIKLIEESVISNPRPEAFTILGNCLINLDEIERAQEALLSAIEINENYEEALYLLAEIEEDGTKAIELYKAAIGNDINYQLAWAGLGKRLLKKGDYEEAVEALLKAIDLNVNDIWSHLYLANAYWSLNRLESADIFYSKANDLEPKNPLIIKFYCEFLESIGNSKKAEEIKRINNNSPGNGKASSHL
ncbi:MAG: tetratricopeptide repeat protein [Cyanothece sp. SIO1E1]|nr:tetratricopeptide repeat protein [Cyanothece sp. SIO1E1]